MPDALNRPPSGIQDVAKFDDHLQPWPRQPSAPPDAGLQWERFVAALSRYKWIMVLVVFVGVGASVIASRLIRPSYAVQATIWISSETPQGRTTGPIRAGELVNSHAWPDLLRSFTILDAVVSDVALYLTPEDTADAALFTGFALADAFAPGDYELRVGVGGRYLLENRNYALREEGAVGDSIGRSVGFRWQPPAESLGGERQIRFAVVTPRDASIALRERLTVLLPTESNLLRVLMEGDNAKREALTMNTLIREFVATAASLKRGKHADFARTLQQQLAYAEQELRHAEIALERFRVNTITLPTEGGPFAAGVEVTRDPVFSSYFAQKIEYDDLSFERQTLERTIRDIRGGGLDVLALLPLPIVQTRAPELRAALDEYGRLGLELRAARRTFTDEHHRVKSLVEAMELLKRGTIPQLADAVVRDLSVRAAALEQRIGAASQELRSIPTRTIEEMRLRRNVEVREILYTTLKNGYEQARIAEASALPDVSILDSAIAPLRPTSQSAPRIILLGTIASIVAAFVLALALDHTDGRVRYPSQVTGDLGVPILGYVPTIRRSRNGNRRSDETAQVVEAFRSLRLNVQHAIGSARPLVVTVSSPGVGEGKSLISANLALSYAEAGNRTLLIDGDIRCGKLHATFGASRRPGLIDFLGGSSSLPEILRTTGQDRLTLLPSGSRRRRGPELLSSATMQRTLHELGRRFDVIIVDSAPLGAGVDSLALGALTGHLLLVLRAGSSDRRMTEARLQVLDRLPVHLVGAVVNDVPPNGVYRYHSYLYGYGMESEEEAVPRLLTAGVSE